MGTPLEIVKELYAKLTAGDAGGALALMSEDVEWITMMDYKGALQGLYAKPRFRGQTMNVGQAAGRSRAPGSLSGR